MMENSITINTINGGILVSIPVFDIEAIYMSDIKKNIDLDSESKILSMSQDDLLNKIYNEDKEKVVEDKKSKTITVPLEPKTSGKFFFKNLSQVLSFLSCIYDDSGAINHKMELSLQEIYHSCLINNKI